MPEKEDNQALEGPSKTALKKQMTALQQLGETLAALSDRQLATIPIEDERLRQAIAEVRRIRSNSARRRHMQFIGKLMRDIDPGPIERALEQLRAQRQSRNDAFHQLEALRDQVLEQGLPAVESVVTRYPNADRQQLRQLVLQHQRERKNNKPPAASRKLFRYLKVLAEESEGE